MNVAIGLKRLRTPDLNDCKTDEPSRLTETGFQSEISDARREFQERQYLLRTQATRRDLYTAFNGNVLLLLDFSYLGCIVVEVMCTICFDVELISKFCLILRINSYYFQLLTSAVVTMCTICFDVKQLGILSIRHIYR